MVEDSLKLLNFHTGTAADAIWQQLVRWDPDELLAAREEQKMALARYGRQDLHKWADVPVPEIRRWYMRLANLLERESAVTHSNES